MKMNLSVVMQTIDKMSAPLKKITATQSKYSKQIAQAKEQGEKLANSQALISQYRKTGAETAKTTAKFNAAKQKLAKLSDKMKAAKQPSAALQQQMKKQQEVVKNLKATQGAYIQSLTKTQNKMKAAGINVKRLSSEEKRLSKEYDSQINKVAGLAKNEERLQRVRAKLAKFKLPSIGGAAMAKGGALLGGLSFAGLFSQVNEAAGEMDTLSKSAQNIDMPVEELQAMQSQAEHAGVSAGSMTGAMVRFTKRLGTLQTTGAGALGSFLKKGKNPLFKELKTAKTTQEAYNQLLDSFSKLKTNQEQMAFADAAFGTDGRKMLIMLREGTTGLTNARKEFNDLGGGIKSEDAQKAEAYNDALQKIQEAVSSMKFAALAPIMEKMTVIFTEFSNKFKNAKWRTEVIEKLKEVVTSLFNGFKLLGQGLLFISQHIPEVVAGLALFKIAMFALNAAMVANPIGLIVAGVAALVVGIGYGINALGGWNVVWGAICDTMRSAWQGIKDVGTLVKLLLMPAVDGISVTFGRVSSGVGAAINMIKSNLLTVPRAIMKMMSLIPSKLLPDGWGDSIKATQKKLEEFNTGLKTEAKAKIEYAIKGPNEFETVNNKLDPVKESVKAVQPNKSLSAFYTQKPRLPYQYGMMNNKDNGKIKAVREDVKAAQPVPQVNQTDHQTQAPLAKNQSYGGMLRNPVVQSKAQVDVRIKSDKPVEIAKAESDKHTEMNVETFDLLGMGF